MLIELCDQCHAEKKPGSTFVRVRFNPAGERTFCNARCLYLYLKSVFPADTTD